MMNFIFISFFKNNGFPVQFIESKINKFLHSKYCNIPNNETNNQKLYFSLPFFGHQSEKLKDDLLNLLRQYFPDYSSNIILVNRFTIGSLFRNKDTLNKGMFSAVVYKFCVPRVWCSVCWVYQSEPSYSCCRTCRD